MECSLVPARSGSLVREPHKALHCLGHGANCYVVLFREIDLAQGVRGARPRKQDLPWRHSYIGFALIDHVDLACSLNSQQGRRLPAAVSQKRDEG